MAGPASARSIVIRFLGNTQGLNSSMSAAERRMHSFRKGVAVASGAAVASLAALGKSAIDAAATQAANFSKYEQITKMTMDSTAAVTARSLNLSQAAYADYYAQLSAMYQSNGIGVQNANQFAAEAMKTAADAAAFGNTTVGEAVEAQLGLLKGSGELWEKYSVSIKASDISARLKADGLDKLTGSEAKAADAATRHTLAQEKAKIFLGQAAREAGSLESQNQKLTATLEDLRAKLGEKLLPAAVALVEKFNQMATWAEHNETKLKVLAITVGGLWAVVVGVAAAQRVAAAASALWTGAMWLLNAAFLGNPIGLIVIAVAALAAGFVFAWKKSETFRNIVIGAFNAIVGAVGFAVKALVSYYAWWIDLALLGFQKLLEGLGHLPDWLGGGKADQAAAAIAALRSNVSSAVDHINSEIDRITKVVQIDVNVVTHRYEEKEVGRLNAQNNQAFDDKAWQRKAARDAERAAAPPPAAPKISFPATPVAPMSTGGGAAAKTQKAKVVKEAKKTGQEVLDGFLSGLSSRFPAVEDSLRKWSDKLPAKLGHGLDKVVADAEKRLGRLAKAVDANTAALDKAKTRLADARDRLADYAHEVRGALNALGDLGTHGGGTFEIIRDRLAQSLANARAFQSTMRRLAAAGLSDTALQQLVAAGPGLATQTGQAILAGGQGAVAQINRLQADIDKVAKSTGASMANEFFAAGVKQAEGVLAGLKSKDAQLKKQMTEAGEALVTAVKKGLNLKVTDAGLRVAGKRAAGGPVVGGRSYLVGERGAELFTPRGSGQITPLGGDGGAMSVAIYSTGPTLQDIVRVEVREQNRRTRAAVLAGARRSG